MLLPSSRRALPDALEVEGATAILVGHTVGTQNYICLPSGSGFKFVLFTPQATLFDDQGKQIITHCESCGGRAQARGEDGAKRAVRQ
jgi:hypothetical protein